MWEHITTKSCTRDTMNLSTWRRTQKRSHVTCHMSHVTCHMPPVTYNLSLMPKATDPHPANYTIMDSRLVCKDPKTKKVRKHKKLSNCFKKRVFFSFPILAIYSSTRSLQLSGFQSLTEGTYIFVVHTNIANSRNWSSGDSVKMKMWDCKI